MSPAVSRVSALFQAVLRNGRLYRAEVVTLVAEVVGAATAQGDRDDDKTRSDKHLVRHTLIVIGTILMCKFSYSCQ